MTAADTAHTKSEGRTAKLYRMDMPDHLCPYGLKSRALLRWKGHEVEDHRLTTRAEVDSFREQAGVETTPQTYIGGDRIGGYEDLRAYFGIPVRAEGRPPMCRLLRCLPWRWGLRWRRSGPPSARLAWGGR